MATRSNRPWLPEGMGGSNLAVDHLVYAAPTLEEGAARIREILGAEPVPGGKHARWGTHNALLGLGGERYLEIIAPDPDAPPPDRPRPFGLDDLDAPRLATWALRSVHLEAARQGARSGGVDPGEILEGSRELPDGSVLRWRLTDPASDRAGGVVPFLIDWTGSDHPSAALPHRVTLLSLRAQHPDPGSLLPVLATLGAWLPVEPGPDPALLATLEGPRGRVELR